MSCHQQPAACINEMMSYSESVQGTSDANRKSSVDDGIIITVHASGMVGTTNNSEPNVDIARSFE